MPKKKKSKGFTIPNFSKSYYVERLWQGSLSKGKYTEVETVPFKNFAFFALSLNILVIIFVLLVRSFLPPQVPLFYGRAIGEEQLASSLSLIIPSLSSFIILGANMGISYAIESEFTKKTLVLAGIAATFFSAITTIKIVALVGSF